MAVGIVGGGKGLSEWWWNCSAGYLEKEVTIVRGGWTGQLSVRLYARYVGMNIAIVRGRKSWSTVAIREKDM